MSKPDSFFEVFEEEKGEVKIKEIGEIKSGEEDEENEAETERENETSEGNSGPSKLKFETLKFLKKQQEVHVSLFFFLFSKDVISFQNRIG